jgi:protein SCO1/2
MNRSVCLSLLLAASGAVAAEPHCHKAEPATYLRTVKHYAAPEVTLIDQDGQRVPLSKILEPGGPLALNFIFTTCTTICPVMTATFSGLRRRLGSEADQLRMVSISIDPERDRPSTLKAYAERFKAPPAWRFYTGTTQEIAAVMRAFDIFSGNKVNHRPVAFFRGAFEKDWVRLEGLATSEQLAAELHPAHAER